MEFGPVGQQYLLNLTVKRRSVNLVILVAFSEREAALDSLVTMNLFSFGRPLVMC